LLESCNDGKALLMKEYLDNSTRSKLCDIIIHNELKNDPNTVVPSSRLLFWAQQIVTIFKKEHTSTYFIPYINFNNQKKKAKGKLLSSLYKYRKRYRNLGLIVKRRTSVSSSEPSPSANSNFDLAHLFKSKGILLLVYIYIYIYIQLHFYKIYMLHILLIIYGTN
jgi:hypothetical protein